MGRKACINGTLYQTFENYVGKETKCSRFQWLSLNDILEKDNEVLELLIGNWKPNKTMPLSGIWKQSHFLQWEGEDQSQSFIIRTAKLPYSVWAALTKIPQTGWFINNKHLFLICWNLGSLRSRPRRILCLGRPTSWFIDSHLSLCSHTAEWARQLSLGPLFEKEHSLHLWGFHPYDLITSLQQPHLQIPSHWKLGVNIWILRGHKHSVSTTILQRRLKSEPRKFCYFKVRTLAKSGTLTYGMETSGLVSPKLWIVRLSWTSWV